jgi:hypothetical protein
MNKIYLVALVAFLSLGLVASAAYARDSMEKTGYMTFNSFDLIGVAVRNPQGRFLGLVNGIMIGSDGQAFAIVNHGDYDIYGPGGVNTPVPIAALRISETEYGKDKIVLNTDTEHLDFAPYLDPTKSHDPQYEANIDRYFGVQPAWTAEGSSPK